MKGGDVDLVDRVRARLAAEGLAATPGTVAAVLRGESRVIGTPEVLRIVDLLRGETRGAGPLEQLLHLHGVTDVLVNGPEEVYVDRGEGLERQPMTFPDDLAVRRLAQRLAAHAGRRLDDASPWVDARLDNGTRVHAVLAPIARPGTLISLRVPARRSFSLDALVLADAVAPTMRDELRRLISHRASFVVTGGTGTGKTTVLSALLAEIEPAERILVVEDATELRPDHPHVVGLESRPANVEGAGLVTLRDLVRQALRMRPDRLVVGEVRGAEVVDLLAALNTGHDGGSSTLHANTAASVPARFEALGVAAGLSREAVHSQLAAGLQAVVHLVRDGRGRREVRELAVVEPGPDGLARVVSAWLRTADGVEQGPGFDRWQDMLR